MKKLLILSIIAVAFVFQLSAAASGAATGSAKPAGAIAGRVTDESGKPVAGASAEAYSCADYLPAGSARTNQEGEYTIAAVQDGCYRVRFAGNGFESSWHGIDNSENRDQAGEVKVSGEKVKGIDGDLAVAGSVISGTVKGPDGKPLAGAWVTALRPATEKSQGSISDARTDDKGAYSVGVYPGTYFVIFTRTGYVTQVYGKSLEEPSQVPAAAGKTATGIDGTLSQGARITGSVTDEAGRAVEGISVVAQLATGKALPVIAKTDGEGKYALEGLGTGKYLVIFGDRENKYLVQWYNGKTSPQDAALVAVTVPAATTGVNAVVRQSGGISGRVTDASGNAIENVMVFAEPAVGSGIGAAFATTDETGSYTIKGLASGSYKVVFRTVSGAHLPSYYRDAENAEKAQPVEVTTAQVTPGIDQVLQEGTYLTGTVSSSAGAPIPGASLLIYPATGDSKGESQYAATGPDGVFSVAVPEGEYVIQAFAEEQGYLPQWSGNRQTREEATPVTVSKKEEAKKVDFVLSLGGTISGVVRNSVGAGIAGVHVQASDVAGDGDEIATTEEGGKFQIKALKSGSYYITADGARVGYIEAKLPQPVAVAAPAATESVDLVLTKGGAISGKVTDSEGNPLMGVSVAAYDPDTWDEVGSEAATGIGGEYTIGGLPEKSYRLRFEKGRSKYAVQWYKGKFRREDSGAVEVRGTATVAGVDVTLSYGVPLTGVVSDTKGVGLSSAKVEIYGGSEDEPFAETTTDASGNYTVPALAPGNYRIRFSHDDHVPRWYGGSDRRTAATLTVREGGVGPVNAALAEATGKFSGKLMNPQGQKIGQAWLTAIDAATGVAVADERICECSGQFHTPVPAGTYQIRVERHGQVVWFGGNSREEAIPLPAAGEIAGLEMVLEDQIVRVKKASATPGGK